MTWEVIIAYLEAFWIRITQLINVQGSSQADGLFRCLTTRLEHSSTSMIVNQALPMAGLRGNGLL